MRLIDVDELKEWTEAWFDVNKYYHPYSKRKTIPTVELFDILDRIPTVDPVKHGRWLDDYNAEENPFFRKGWKCSACGSRNTYGKPKFCMNCGAQMDGESNET